MEQQRLQVCAPRQVWTAAICFGWSMSRMSKIRTPLNRSLLTESRTPCVPQSTRAPAAQAPAKNEVPWIGQVHLARRDTTYAVRSARCAGSVASQYGKPSKKSPWTMKFLVNARSELIS